MSALVWFGLSAVARAVSPAPDGGYPGGNTAEGQNALLSRTTGGFNTAIGFLSLRSDTTNSFNTAVGAGALLANTADENTATGAGALLSNTTGTTNTANGVFALFLNTTGNGNTANGYHALLSSTIGLGNTASGFNALLENTTGGENTAVGEAALALNTTGSDNTALGTLAGSNLTVGSNNIDIGFSVQGVAGESNTIRIGNPNVTTTIIQGISGQTIASGATVLVDSNGMLGTVPSSRRFKDGIKPMDQASEAILGLKPVTFHYKSDNKGTPQFGLIAEEVAAVNSDLVVRDKNGEVYTVRYDAVNAMLLNEFLKEHRKVEALEGTVATLAATVKEQASQIQKVSAQLEVSKAAPRTVLNNR
jgi:hypothetical protein